MHSHRNIFMLLCLSIAIPASVDLQADEAASPLSARTEQTAKKTKIVFVAGPKSHGYGAHEHNAGCLLLAKAINQNVPQAEAVVYRDGWPQKKDAFHNVAAIIIFADGYGSNPMNGHFMEINALMENGVGLSLLHYATAVDAGWREAMAIDWAGGLFVKHLSVHPFWTAEFKDFPDHPITRGVKPFAIEDEWYYNMRFPTDMKGIYPVLTAVPPENTRTLPDSAYDGNPIVRANKGRPEHLAWAFRRPDGGRSFGLTGGHYHANWADDSFRKLILNSCLWVAGIEVPPNGVKSRRPTLAELEANQDYSKPKEYDNGREIMILAR